MMLDGNIQNKDYKILNEGDVIYIYSQPIELATVGIIDNIFRQIINLKTIKREHDNSKNNNGKIISVFLNDKLSITILDSEKQKRFLTTAELKRLKEIQLEQKEESEQILWKL